MLLRSNDSRDVRAFEIRRVVALSRNLEWFYQREHDRKSLRARSD